MRSAHTLLEHYLPDFISAGLKVGDQVEAEVVYGELPNVVPYSASNNYIVFLRTTAGDVDINRLAEKFDNQSYSFSLTVPYTTDGREINLREETNTWTFSKPIIIENDVISVENFTNTMINDLSSKDRFTKQTYATILEVPLNKIPDWVESGTWKEVKEHIKERRDEISRYMLSEYVMPVKGALLDQFVKNRKSAFGPLVEDGGWIEGIVLRHPNTGKMVKVVDKNKFGVLREAIWETRNKITDSARTIEQDNLSFMAGLKIAMGTAIGYPELGTAQARKYVQEALDADIDILAEKEYWLALFEEKALYLEALLDKYEKEEVPILIESAGKSLAAGSRNRTLQTFAETFSYIREGMEATLYAKTQRDLLNVLVGKYLGNLT